MTDLRVDPHSFIIIYGVAGVLMVLSIYVTRFQRRKPTQLNLRAPKNPIASPVPPPPTTYSPQWESPSNPSRATQLTIMFNFNGHSWEAFEVLGIPAGSSLEAARTAHGLLVATLDPDSRVFYDLALDAILHSVQRAS